MWVVMSTVSIMGNEVDIAESSLGLITQSF